MLCKRTWGLAPFRSNCKPQKKKTLGAASRPQHTGNAQPRDRQLPQGCCAESWQHTLGEWGTFIPATREGWVRNPPWLPNAGRAMHTSWAEGVELPESLLLQATACPACSWAPSGWHRGTACVPARGQPGPATRTRGGCSRTALSPVRACSSQGKPHHCFLICFGSRPLSLE